MSGKYAHPPATLGRDFDSAIIGEALPTPTSETVIVYDYNILCSLLAKKLNCSREDAEEYARVHYLERYLGIACPVFCVPSPHPEEPENAPD